MVPSDNVAFIDLQPTRARRHVGRIRHERNSVEINQRAPQWSHNAVWNRKYMEPKPGYTLRQLWADSEPAIGHKSSVLWSKREWHSPGSSCYRRPAILHAAWQSLHPRVGDASSSKCPTTNWHLGTDEPWRNGSAPCVKTRQLRSLSRCKPADRPSSKRWRRNAYCHCPWQATRGR